MRRVIDGLIYDTEEAEGIASANSGYPAGDFRGMEETLYRTKNGNWFLCGEGGPMTKYAIPVGNMKGGGRKLIPMIDDIEVLAWLEEHEETEAIEKYFSEKLKEA